MILRRRKKRLAELDEAVARAEAERATSQERLARMRSEVISPLVAEGRRNQFMDRIRLSMREGRP